MLLKHCRNNFLKKSAPYPALHQATLSLKNHAAAMLAISSWEGYSVTPLHRLGHLSQQLGLGGVWYKDESERFHLKSFKALGGAYAVSKLLKHEVVKAGLASAVSDADLLEGKYRGFIGGITVTSATDGNHGRSVAWGASIFGCRCVIYIHEHVSEERETAIQAFGAEVIRVKGNYDSSVAETEREAKNYGRFVVSDTTYPGYTEIPKDVMQGYTVMVQEALDQMDGKVPTHIFIQAGVGALPAAVIAHCWEAYGPQCPQFIIVEPANAACIYESVIAGKTVAVTGSLDTIMAGLACGEVSPLAFTLIKDAAEACMVISDDAAIRIMRGCASGAYGKKIVCGESAAGGLAGAILAAEDDAFRKQLKLNADSQVLVFGTEGATAPSIYRSIVGKTPAEVLA